MSHPEELLRGLGRVRAIMVALLASAVVLLATASPVTTPATAAHGGSPFFVVWAEVEVPTLEVDRANGAFNLSHEIASPSDLAWLLNDDDDALVVEGRWCAGRCSSSG